MRISDWSSDVCSSDLEADLPPVEYLPHEICLPELPVRLGLYGLCSDDKRAVLDSRRSSPALRPRASSMASEMTHAWSSSDRPARTGLARIIGWSAVNRWGWRVRNPGCAHGSQNRTAERRVGKEGVSTCRSRGS